MSLLIRHPARAPSRKFPNPFSTTPRSPSTTSSPPRPSKRFFENTTDFSADDFTTRAYFNKHSVLWAFLLQTLSDGKSRSCSTAVGRIAAFCHATGEGMPDSNTGDYCKARAKLPADALRELVLLVAKNTETVANPEWLWGGKAEKGRHHAKLVDGFTATMPDTPENQAKFPQHKKQAEGCGFPIMRICVVQSLATAMVLDAAFAEYKGKETGESALLRKMFDSFDPDDVAVFDRYCCSYMMLALFQQQGVHVCTRINANRIVDFRKGKRLGEYDRLAVWKRPQRPEWMSKEVYETIPKTMELRMIQYSLVCRGRRSKTITVVTVASRDRRIAFGLEASAPVGRLSVHKIQRPTEAGLGNGAEAPSASTAGRGHRWNVELDIRQIKQTLNVDHFRCKSPEMVEREFWVTLLGYNLVRKTMCEAANFIGVLPRRLSFTRTAAHLLDLRCGRDRRIWRDF